MITGTGEEAALSGHSDALQSDMSGTHPLFVVSLDFELYWGMRDMPNLSAYMPNLIGARAAIPEILKLFDKYSIHATWAAVGCLFADGTEELRELFPRVRPGYYNRHLSPYNDLPPEGSRETAESIFFAPSIIRRIAATDNQEVASHTFSHYYCLEAGQDSDCFTADLDAAVEAARHLGLQLKSLVFPRNQCEPQFLKLCAERGIIAYRGNPDSWLYRPVPEDEQRSIRRLGRLLDAYFPLCLRTIQDVPSKTVPINVCASRFLRPYTPALRRFERLRLQRIKREMTLAARENRMYHVWWHPHNFGVNSEFNLAFLNSLLQYYRELRDSHGMLSANMREVAERCLSDASMHRAA